MEVGSPLSGDDTSCDGMVAGLGPLFRSADWASVVQAFEIASAIGADTLAALIDGVFIDEEGRLAWTTRWAQAVPVKGVHREDAALLALSLAAGGPLAEVRELDLSELDSLSRLEPLAEALLLEVLKLDACPAVRDLSPVARLPRLRELHAAGTSNLDPPPTFRPGNSLTYLSLSNGQTRELACLGSLETLRTLVLRDWHNLRDLQALAAALRLERLTLADCPMLASLAPLAALTALRRLSVTGLRSTLALDPLAGLPHLEELNLSDWHVRVNLIGLRGARRLRELDVSGCSGAVGLDTLLWLEHPDQLALPGLEEDLAFRQSPKDLDVLLAELTHGSGPLPNFHEGAQNVRRVVAAGAVLETIRDRERFAHWSSAQPIWQHAMRIHPELARNAVGRIGLKRDGTLWWPAGCTLAHLFHRFEPPGWIDEALRLCARQLLPSS